MSDGTNSARYAYLANSPLVSRIALKQNFTAQVSPGILAIAASTCL